MDAAEGRFCPVEGQKKNELPINTTGLQNNRERYVDAHTQVVLCTRCAILAMILLLLVVGVGGIF